MELFPNTTYWIQKMLDTDIEAEYQYYSKMADQAYEWEKRENDFNNRLTEAIKRDIMKSSKEKEITKW